MSDKDPYSNQINEKLIFAVVAFLLMFIIKLVSGW